MEKELKEIINKLKKVRTETTSKVSDEVLWDSAIRILNTGRINKKRSEERRVGNE